jgi:hypothetical protein
LDIINFTPIGVTYHWRPEELREGATETLFPDNLQVLKWHNRYDSGLKFKAPKTLFIRGMKVKAFLLSNRVLFCWSRRSMNDEKGCLSCCTHCICRETQISEKRSLDLKGCTEPDNKAADGGVWYSGYE